MGCPFCIRDFNILLSNQTALAFNDKMPVVKDHILVIPKEHKEDLLKLNDDEMFDCLKLVREVCDYLKKKDGNILGFNIGANIGKAAGQTIFHSHIHIIPRRKGDNNGRKFGNDGIRTIIINNGDE